MLLSTVAGSITAITETIRLVGMLSLVQLHEDKSVKVQLLLGFETMLISILTETLDRVQLAASLRPSCCGTGISSEEDLLLRTRFVFPYTPLVTIVFLAYWAFAGQYSLPNYFQDSSCDNIAWLLTTWVLLALDHLGNLVSDAIIVLFHSRHIKPAQSFRATLTNLQGAGGHRIISWKCFVSASGVQLHPPTFSRSHEQLPSGFLQLECEHIMVMYIALLSFVVGFAGVIGIQKMTCMNLQ